MDEKQYQALVDKIGVDAANQIKKEMQAVEISAKKVAEEAVKNGGVTKEQFDQYQTATKTLTDKLEDITKSQGTTINELREKLNGNGTGNKSIAEVFEENREEIKRVFQNGSGTKQFIVGLNRKGEYVMVPHDPTAKAAGPMATVSGIGDVSNVSSIAQSLGAASILRSGGNAPIISQFRNTPWVFDLVNLQNASMEQLLAIWFEEEAKVGSSATVLEGGTKPSVQYKYRLRSSEYRKEAALIGMTDEFSIDFSRLETDILNKGRLDVMNRINAAVLARITAAATAYNTAANFGPPVPFANEFDAIAAMAAQVDNATFGYMANAALMSTFKKYRMGINKAETGEYLNRPEVIGNLNFVGNPDMGTDDIIVGDLKNYNIILRGGFIVKVGYNGTDFAENRFSIVMEQYYYDYISEVRKPAIVKGPNFDTVLDSIEAAS